MADAELEKRRVNEAIERGRRGEPDGTFICECGRTGCTEMLHLPLAEYARVRSSFERFLVAPGHVLTEVQTSTEDHGGYAVAVRQRPRTERDDGTDPRKDES